MSASLALHWSISWVTKTASLSGKEKLPGQWYISRAGGVCVAALLSLMGRFEPNRCSKDPPVQVSPPFLQCCYLVLSQGEIHQQDNTPRNGSAQKKDVSHFQTFCWPSSILCKYEVIVLEATHLPPIPQLSNCPSMRSFKQKEACVVSLLPTKVRIFSPHLHVLNIAVRGWKLTLRQSIHWLHSRGKQQWIWLILAKPVIYFLSNSSGTDICQEWGSWGPGLFLIDHDSFLDFNSLVIL